jgi:hypothetical protein
MVKELLEARRNSVNELDKKEVSLRVFIRDKDEDGVFIGTVPSLKGCYF